MNTLVWSVAGSRKTQSIVETCAASDDNSRRLLLTYTRTAQADLSRRVYERCEASSGAPSVMGWYTFLLRHLIRPYLTVVYPGRRLNGFSFDGLPGMYAKGAARYLNSSSQAYRCHLSKLAVDVANATQGAAIQRLEGIYTEIIVDEVQDLTGSDLDILEMLFQSSIDVRLIGDVRQSVLSTNDRDARHKQFRGIAKRRWYEGQAAAGRLAITETLTTWRFNQEIADFADKLFSPEMGFGSTVSKQGAQASHHGIFSVRKEHAITYYERYKPSCLRDAVTTGRDLDLPYRNFGLVKGLTLPHVLIYPVSTVVKYLTDGSSLASLTACRLYVGVTRAEHSVAFVLSDPAKSSLVEWTP